MIFEKSAKTIKSERTVFSKNTVDKTENHMQKSEVRPFPCITYKY